MNLFLLVTNILFRLIAVNTEFPVVYPQETFLAEGENSISWPIVEGDFNGIENINELLEYHNFTGETLAETRENFLLCGRGIIGSSFQVNWMNSSYLDLTITVETLGAYPSKMVFNRFFDLHTGQLVKAENLFLEEEMDNLVELCNDELQNRIPEEITEEYEFTLENLEQVGMRRSGIIFHYDFQFAHAVEALEPDGELFFYWGDINEYLKAELRR